MVLTWHKNGVLMIVKEVHIFHYLSFYKQLLYEGNISFHEQGIYITVILTWHRKVMHAYYVKQRSVMVIFFLTTYLIFVCHWIFFLFFLSNKAGKWYLMFIWYRNVSHMIKEVHGFHYLYCTTWDCNNITSAFPYGEFT